MDAAQIFWRSADCFVNTLTLLTQTIADLTGDFCIFTDFIANSSSPNLYTNREYGEDCVNTPKCSGH